MLQLGGKRNFPTEQNPRVGAFPAYAYWRVRGEMQKRRTFREATAACNQLFTSSDRHVLLRSADEGKRSMAGQRSLGPLWQGNIDYLTLEEIQECAIFIDDP